MASGLEDHCPICLDSWEEASFVMPCLHQFCYPCILRWADSKPKCPLCKRKILSILHSVRADDDYMEHVVTPSVTPSAVLRQEGGAPRRPATHGLHRPGAPRRQAPGGVPRRPVGSLQPSEWVILFRNCPTLLQILQPWVQERLRQIFENRRSEAATVEDAIMAILTTYGMDTRLLVQMLRVFLQDHTVRFVRQLTRVTVQRCGMEARRLLGWQDTHAAGGRESSPVDAPAPAASQGGSLTPSPAPTSSPVRSRVDELPGTSSTAFGGGPGSHPSAPIAIPVEQDEPQEEPEESVPGLATSSQGSEHSPGGPRRPPKRRASSFEGSPASKRPTSHQ